MVKTRRHRYLERSREQPLELWPEQFVSHEVEVLVIVEAILSGDAFRLLRRDFFTEILQRVSHDR